MTVRFSIALRLLSLMPPLILVYRAFADGRVSYLTGGAMLAAATGSIYAWGYKATIGRVEIGVKYFPLVDRSVPWSDVLQIVDGYGPLCIARNLKFRIWGLTPAKRNEFWKFVPADLAVSSGPPDRNTITSHATKKYSRIARASFLALVAVLAMLAPFLNDNPLNAYWSPFGSILLVVALCLFLLLMFSVGMALIHWQASRDLADDRPSSNKKVARR